MDQRTGYPEAAERADALTEVRSGLAVSASDLLNALEQVEPTDRRRQRALDRWFAGLARQVRSYHDLVDAMIVPALAARGGLDQRALDTLAADHAWVDQLLGDLGDALGVLSFGLGAESWWLAKATDLAAALDHVLRGQLAREQRLFGPLVERWFDADERDVLRHESGRVAGAGRLARAACRRRALGTGRRQRLGTSAA